MFCQWRIEGYMRQNVKKIKIFIVFSGYDTAKVNCIIYITLFHQSPHALIYYDVDGGSEKIAISNKLSTDACKLLPRNLLYMCHTRGLH